ncbi:hypothetical protein [Streptomyces sp. BBFR109]|uniref:hypothetical protein n=1 Tax=Streptomyces sp. BBFR109 TaxID=3448172 RepID=UPI003F75C672
MEEYIIVESETYRGLASAVNDMIREGYRPIGGVCAITGGGYQATTNEGFLQAMRLGGSL